MVIGASSHTLGTQLRARPRLRLCARAHSFLSGRAPSFRAFSWCSKLWMRYLELRCASPNESLLVVVLVARTGSRRLLALLASLLGADASAGASHAVLVVSEPEVELLDILPKPLFVALIGRRGVARSDVLDEGGVDGSRGSEGERASENGVPAPRRRRCAIARMTWRPSANGGPGCRHCCCARCCLGRSRGLRGRAWR